MITKVMRYVKPDDEFFIVEYQSGKCKKFYRITDPIIKFVSNIAPTCRRYNNGAMIVYTWE